MRGPASSIVWIIVYLVLVTAPLALLLSGPVPPGAGFWWDFSMAIGFAGIAVMGVQFALTARFRYASAPFGIDIIYYFHRYAAIVGMVLVLAHFGILWAAYPASLGRLNPLAAPLHMTAGRVALVLFAIVIVTSLWRKQLRIDYQVWRIAHALMATAALLLSVFHVHVVGYYTRAPLVYGLWVAFTLFWVLLIVHVRVVRPWALLAKPYRVVAVRPERGNSWTLDIEPDGHPGLRFAPGQFAWLTLRGSPYSFDEHPFSFIGNALEPQRLQFTIKELGDFTSTIGTIQPGERAYVDGPYGVFSVDRQPRAPAFVFIAAGVGIAPIMSMLRTLAARGDKRRLFLFYANRDWDGVILREEIEALRDRLDLTLVHILEHPPEDWHGARGLIDRSLLEESLPPDYREFVYFICGPVPMSEAVQRALHAMGVPRRRVKFEIFDMV
jgi:predicted ferric reductase